MHWSDEGIVLSARPHGESGAILQLLTREHGRHAGRPAVRIQRPAHPLHDLASKRDQMQRVSFRQDTCINQRRILTQTETRGTRRLNATPHQDPPGGKVYGCNCYLGSVGRL